MQAIAIDVAGRDHPDSDPRCAADDRLEEILPSLRRALLRVVQETERPDAMVAQRTVVEKNARYDERSGQRAAPCLVDTGDETSAEASIEAQELLAGPFLHARDHSALPGGRVAQ